MRWIMAAAAALLFLSCATALTRAGEDEILTPVCEINIKTDDGSRVVVGRGTVLSYEIRYAVVPQAFVMNLKAAIDGGLSAPSYMFVSQMDNGHPLVGSGHKRIQVTALRPGLATVTVTYEEGVKRIPRKKVFQVEVE